MKKFAKLTLVAFVLAALFALAACRGDGGGGGGYQGETPEGGLREIAYDDPLLAESGLELVEVDGEYVFRFIETRDITVLSWNRAAERQPDIRDSAWVSWIQAEVLRVHNINVTFDIVYRWDEDTAIASLLAARDAPDLSYTFQFPTVQNLGNMGGIIDLFPLMMRYRDLLPNFYELQGTENIYWNRDSQTGEMWAFAGRHYASNLRINTYVRTDWLERLNIAEPTTLQEFEDMLVAFRDNAAYLLPEGRNPDMLIPFRLTQDSGWTGDPIITSFIPNEITDREWFIYGFDDRRFTMPGIKEGVRVLNRWYNMGLIWPDFALHDAGESIGDDLIMLGYVGSMSTNWDAPFRGAPNFITGLQEHGDPNGNFTVVTPFLNDAGIVRKQVPHGTDRSIFLPATNTEPLATLLYLDFISRPEVRDFLMFGNEGMHFERGANGDLRNIPLTEVPDEWYFPVIRNYDLLPMFNGIPPLSNPDFAPLAYDFTGISAEQVVQAVDAGMNHAWTAPRAIVREIQAESDFGGGLNAIRNQVLNQSITASESEFDAVFDAGMENYMRAGGRAIIEERRAAWLEAYGDVDWVPVE